jgi:hypothetical protein
VGTISLCTILCSRCHRALRISRQPVVESLEGKWDSQRNDEKIRGTILGVGQAMWNERL